MEDRLRRLRETLASFWWMFTLPVVASVEVAHGSVKLGSLASIVAEAMGAICARIGGLVVEAKWKIKEV